MNGRGAGGGQRGRAGIAVALAAVLWLALHPAAALAHAEEARTSPVPGAVLSAAPDRVDVWFTEQVAKGVTAIQVFDAQRRRVDRGVTTVDPADGKHAWVDLQPLSSGLYTVVWSNVSADDGHPNKGGFAFTVLLPTATPAPVVAGAAAPPALPTPTLGPVPTALPLPSQSSQAVADLLNPATDRPTAAVDLVSGWLVFSTLVLAGGGALFALLCLLPALARAGGEGAAFGRRLHRRFLLLALGCALLGALAALVSLLAKAEIATGLPPGDLFSGTVLGALLAPWSGRVWLVREAAYALVAAVALLGLALGRRAAEGPPAGARPGLAAIALLGAVGLVCQALDSHLAAGHVARPGPLGTVDLCLHLLAVATWVGGLGYAAILLWPVWRRLPSSVQIAVTSEAIARFSPLALACVGLITLTGGYAAILLIPSPADLLTSAYGQALDFKIALLLVLILFGASNRHTLAQVAATRGQGLLAAGGRGSLLHRLRTGAGQVAAATLATAGAALDAVEAPARAPRQLVALLLAAGRRLVRAMGREFAVASLVLLAAGTMLEVGPPGTALAAGEVRLSATAALPPPPATAALASAATPMARPRPSPTPAAYAAAIHAGDLAIQFSAEPALAGATTRFQVGLTGAGGAPVDHAEVKLRLTARALDLGTQVLTAAAAGAGRYAISAPAFAAPGDWQVLLVIRRDTVPEVDATLSVPVQPPAVAAATAVPTATPVPTATAAPQVLHATLALQPDPPVVGGDRAIMRLSDGDGQPVTGAQVQVLWLMPQHAHTSQSTLAPVVTSPGAYAGGLAASMAGAWLASAGVTLPDGRTAQLQFAFNVRDRGLFGQAQRVVAAVAAAHVDGNAAMAAADARRPAGIATPAMVMNAQPAPVASDSGPAQTQALGDLAATVRLAPASDGQRVIVVELRDGQGRPALARAVALQVAMQGMEQETSGVAAAPAGPGRYEARVPSPAMAGTWLVTLRLQIGEGSRRSALFTFPVAPGAPLARGIAMPGAGC